MINPKAPMQIINSKGIKQRVDLKKISAISVFIIILLYCLTPILSSVHVEGFSAQTESIALLKATHPTVIHDPYLPRVTDYILYTRSAVINILTAIYYFFPTLGNTAYKILVIFSFVLLIASSSHYAKKTFNVPYIHSLIALLATNGICEISFFYNDNIVSAAFLALALALIRQDDRVLFNFVSGISAGIALLCRLDAVFAAPLFLLTVWFFNKSLYISCKATATIVLGTVFCLLISAWINGFYIWTQLLDMKDFFKLVQYSSNLGITVRTYFFGFMIVPFIAIGSILCLSNPNRDFYKNRLYTALCLVFAFILIIFSPKLSEIRYVLPLLSVAIAIYGGLGVQFFFDSVSSRLVERKQLFFGLSLYCLWIFFSPATFLWMHDGPHVLLGRVYSIKLWNQWQKTVTDNELTLQNLANHFEAKKNYVVISTKYNDELYFRLIMIQKGYVPEISSKVFPGCYGFSTFNNGSTRVFHIRTEPQYFLSRIRWEENFALQVSQAFKCKELKSPMRTFITKFGDKADNTYYGYTPVVNEKENEEFSVRYIYALVDSQTIIYEKDYYGILNTHEYTPEEISHLKISADIKLSSLRQNSSNSSFYDIKNYLKTYRSIELAHPDIQPSNYP